MRLSLADYCAAAYTPQVTVLKEASPSFVVMRRLAMRFRGLLRGADAGKLGSWPDDARNSCIYALQQFARILARDIDAVRNAIAEPWNSGQAEGQINQLKTLKRAMCGRTGIEFCKESGFAVGDAFDRFQ